MSVPTLQDLMRAAPIIAAPAVATMAAPAAIDWQNRVGLIDEPAASYYVRELGVCNKSALDRIARSPAHYRAWLAGADEAATPALTFGKALHAYVLEPDSFAAEFIVPDGDAPRRPSITQINAKNPSDDTRAALDYWRDWNAEHGHKTAIDQDTFDSIQRMADALMRHELARNLITGGRREVTARWIDPATALRCKLRCDYYVPELAVAFDLKSTDDARPDNFARSAAKYRYHVQQSHYMDGFKATGHPLRSFFFVAVEKEAPHAISVTYCDDAALERAAELIDRDMRRMRDCIDADRWPGYGDEIQSIALPSWALTGE